LRRPLVMSCRGWRFNIWRLRRQVRRCAWFVHLQFGRLVQESCGNLGVRCCFSQPKQDRRLTHEVLFTDHMNFPVVSQRPGRYAGSGQRFLRVAKSEHIKLGHGVGTGTREPAHQELSPVWNCWNSRVPRRPGLRTDPRTAPAWPPSWGRFFDTRGGELGR
jgi:hypothetical protein